MYISFYKKFFDLLLALIAIPFIAIASIFIVVFIAFDSGMPFLYVSDRIGKNGKVFKMYKFRTMQVNAPDIRLEDGSTYNGSDDPRVTKIGKILRKTSLDELPQIINILKGEMSFIGVRPDPPDWLEKYSDDERLLLSVLPGITGYNQAFFRNSSNGFEKTQNDVYYAKNISALLDIKIFIKTILCVLKSENIYTSSTGELDKNTHNGLKL